MKNWKKKLKKDGEKNLKNKCPSKAKSGAYLLRKLQNMHW